MEQLNLGITPQITYRPDNFVVHSGVRAVCEELEALIKRPEFSFSFIHGAVRSGKTHQAVFIADRCVKMGLFPRMIGADELQQIMTEPRELGSDLVFLVDDADRFFSILQPGDSGPCVNFLEQIRLSQGKVIFWSGKPLEELRFDEHIRSRLTAGSGYLIGVPTEEELPALIDAMARQRGFKLSEKKQEFLERRLPRNVAALEEYLERVAHLSNVLGRKVGFSLLGDAI